MRRPYISVVNKVAGKADVIGRIDSFVGSGLENLAKSHHDRRLRKLGWETAIDPSTNRLWTAGDPPPREGNAVEVLIDGDQIFARVIEALKSAKSHVCIAGWHLEPGFEMTFGETPVVLRDLLAETADRVEVRVLLWGGAPLPPPFRPSRRE